MKWILIILIWSGGSRPATTSVEFTTEKACTEALDTLGKKWGAAHTSFCTPKGMHNEPR